MSGRTIIVVVLALLCGVAAFVGISLIGQGGAAQVKTQPVIFAIAEIRRGEPITKEMLEVRKLPEEMVPPQALGVGEDVVGRIAALKMIPGDAVTDAKLEPKGAKSRVVPPGMLAFTIAKADTPPLEVDDHVDVFFTATGTAAAIDPIQDVLVWDVTIEDTKPGAKNAQGPVALLVDPRQANVLNQGMNKGTLRLVRRNPNDPRREVIAAPEAVATNLSAAIDPETRAYALESATSAVTIGGHLVAGDHVDVLLTRKGEGGRAVSRTLADVPVLGMKAGSSNPAEAQAVVLGVSPGDAALLDRAQTDGTIHLTLRKPGDHGKPATPSCEAASTLASGINPEMRAFTFEAVNPAVTLGGRIRPEDHVDVVMVVTPEGRQAKVAKTIPNVIVLGLSDIDELGGREKQQVTLLVTPVEAEALALAQMTGTLYLSLRDKDDNSMPTTPQSPDAEPEMALALRPGFRAFLYEPEGPAAMLNGKLRRGDHVDVLLIDKTTGSGAGLKPSASSDLVANVEVLGVSMSADSSAAGTKPSVALMVTPDQAVALAHGQAKGSLQLILRNPDDDFVPVPIVPDLEIMLTTRTLRGAIAGSDRLIIRVPVPQALKPNR